MDVLLHPTYFPSISSYVGMVKANHVTFETQDNYQKQTYRNRTHIYAANGKLALHVPVTFSQHNRQFYKDVKIANDGKWQAIHWKSLLSAYSTSPFFEFYKDDLAPLYHSKQEYIMAFNFDCFEVIKACLQWDLEYTRTESFNKQASETLDLRDMVNVRKEARILLEPYTQVFNEKHGFINNLSILDLLFNEGPNTLNYLQSQDLFND